MKKYGVLFDLDGVLIDSETVYTRFWDGIGKEFNTGIPNFALSIKGMTLPAILNTFFNDDETRQLVKQRIRNYEQTMPYRPFPEAMRFVGELNETGIPCAIVTSSSRIKMDNVYKQNPGFRNHFDAVITAEDVAHSKPDPDPYLKGAAALSLPIQDCFVFEDSLSGIESGLRSGATVFGIATTLPFECINKKARNAINSFAGFHISDMLAGTES